MTEINGIEKYNLASIKEGFRRYLEDLSNKKEIEGYSNDENASVSIFLHSEEFKEYLVEELGADVSILNQNVFDIIQEISKEADSSQEVDESEEIDEEAGLGSEESENR